MASANESATCATTSALRKRLDDPVSPRPACFSAWFRSTFAACHAGLMPNTKLESNDAPIGQSAAHGAGASVVARGGRRPMLVWLLAWENAAGRRREVVPSGVTAATSGARCFRSALVWEWYWRRVSPHGLSGCREPESH